MRIASILVLALLLLPGVAAADAFGLHFPEDLRYDEATVLVGRLNLAAGPLVDPVTHAPDAILFSEGTLTVCPIQPEGSALAQVLTTLDSDCQDAESFEDPVLGFGEGTALQWGGEMEWLRMPEGALATLSGGSPHALAMVPSRDGVDLQAPATGSVFAVLPYGPTQTVWVETDDGRQYFNGTGYAFLHDGESVTWQVAGLAGWIAGDIGITLTPAEEGPLHAVLDPFTLLDVQEDLLGPDLREPRRAIFDLFGEFGRVDEFVNAALVGHLNGTVDGEALVPADASLVRSTSLNATLEGAWFNGTLSPRVSITTHGVSVDGGEPQGPLWGLFITLWVAALVVLAVRRHPVGRTRWQHLLGTTGLAAALVLVDAWILYRSFGASAVTETFAGASSRSVLALTVFELVVVAVAWLLVLLPARRILGKVAPDRFHLLGEAVLTVLWLASLMIWPASFFAAGYAFARL